MDPITITRTVETRARVSVTAKQAEKLLLRGLGIDQPDGIGQDSVTITDVQTTDVLAPVERPLGDRLDIEVIEQSEVTSEITLDGDTGGAVSSDPAP